MSARWRGWGLAVLLASGCIFGGGSDDDSAADIDGEGEEAISVGPLVAKLNITQVSINQGVDIVLMEDFNPVDRIQSPIIAGRDALVRVFVEPQEGWEPHNIIGVFSVTNGDDTSSFSTEMTVTVASEIPALQTTINFEIPGDALAIGSTFALSLHEELGVTADGNENTDAARWLSEDTGELDIETSGDVEIVIIPIRYDADGSGRLPDTSPEQLQRYHDLMYATYPAMSMTMTVEEPLPWDSSISAGGSGWDTLLSQISNMRSGANVPENTYFYGLFNADNSLQAFCGFGCVLGLSQLAFSANDDWARASIGIGFTGDTSVETMVHEVGHAHGREHAPCGLYGQPSDNQYPHSNATLGAWGYDLIEGQLKKPGEFRDMMSYCDPLWVSDYTYFNLFVRIRELAPRRSAALAPTTWRAVSIGGDGVSTFDAGEREVRGMPGGELRTVAMLDDAGLPTDEVTGYYYPYTHIDGGMLLIEEYVSDFPTLQLVD